MYLLHLTVHHCHHQHHPTSIWQYPLPKHTSLYSTSLRRICQRARRKMAGRPRSYRRAFVTGTVFTTCRHTTVRDRLLPLLTDKTSKLAANAPQTPNVSVAATLTFSGVRPLGPSRIPPDPVSERGLVFVTTGRCNVSWCDH